MALQQASQTGESCERGPSVKVIWLHPLPACHSAVSHSLFQCCQMQPLCHARYPSSRWQMQQQCLLSTEAQAHCAPTKDFGPWPTSSSSTGGSLCIAFSRREHPELWKCLLNLFFLVLQVAAVVWRDTPRAEGLPGRHNDGWLAAMFSL